MLVIVLNAPLYYGLLFVFFFTRENVKKNIDEFMKGHNNWLYQFHPRSILAFVLFMLWFGSCIAVVMAQHHLLWKRLFNAE